MNKIIADHYVMGKMVIDQIIITERPQKYFLAAKDRPEVEIVHVHDAFMELLGNLKLTATVVEKEGILESLIILVL